MTRPEPLSGSYRAVVNPRTLDMKTFTVSDSIYNFRYNPIEDLTKRADRTITRVYTNNSVALRADGRSRPALPGKGKGRGKVLADEAYAQPDYHAVVGPTYEDDSILRWLLEQ